MDFVRYFGTKLQTYLNLTELKAKKNMSKWTRNKKKPKYNFCSRSKEKYN